MFAAMLDGFTLPPYLANCSGQQCGAPGGAQRVREVWGKAGGSAIAPCVEWLSRRVETLSADKKRLEDELHTTDPAVLTHTIRAAGVMSPEMSCFFMSFQ